MKKLFLIFITTILIGAGCSSDKWQAFYYPDGCLSCEDRYIYSPIYKTLDECRDWADRTKQALTGSYDDDYECGKNCKKEDGFYVCDETLK